VAVGRLARRDRGPDDGRQQRPGREQRGIRPLAPDLREVGQLVLGHQQVDRLGIGAVEAQDEDAPGSLGAAGGELREHGQDGQRDERRRADGERPREGASPGGHGGDSNVAESSRLESGAPMATGKFLFRKVEKAIETIDRAADPSATIMQTASPVIEQFADVLGVRGGRLYVRRDGGYELVRTFGGVPEIAPGLFIPEDYAPIEKVVDEGVAVMDLSAPGVDAELERKL